MSQKENLPRRNFFKIFASLSATLAATVFAVIAGGYLYPIPRKKSKPLFICLESEVSINEPLLIKDPQGHKVILFRNKSKEFLALGTVCTHLGCQVYYRPEKEKFECPCHQGVFDQVGNPISGPPQKPLIKFPVMVKEGKVFIQFA